MSSPSQVGMAHPNYIDNAYLLHDGDVSNYFLENTPNFPETMKLNNKTDENKSPLNVKAENLNFQPNLSPLQPPKSILRSPEKKKTDIKSVEIEKKDEVVGNMNMARRLGSIKDSVVAVTSPNHSALSKRSRQTRLFKGQILENDIFEEKSTTPIATTKTQLRRFREFVEKLTKNPYLEIFFNLLVFYALFADDFRTICLPKSSDDILDSITVVCIFVFTCEILTSLITRKGYFNSFFFYLDIVSTLTLFFDLTYVYEQIFYKSAFANRFQIARASRAARIGTRAGRLVKFFNFEKFFLCLKKLNIHQHLMKLKQETKSRLSPSRISQATSTGVNNLPHAKKRISAKFSKDTASIVLMEPFNALSGLVKRLSRYAAKSLSSQAVEELEEKAQTKESRVGKKLSELTIKRVILITLMLLLFVPVFSTDYQFEKELHIKFDVLNIAAMTNFNQSQVSIDDVNKTINNFISQSRSILKPLLVLKIPQMNISYEWDDLSIIRKADLSTFEDSGITASIDLRMYNSLDSMMNILRTIFICVLFLLGAMIFSKDANDLALRPIERMIEKVNKIANNPLKALEEGIRGTNQNMETVLIENAIIKIGTLLALGFGDAGSEIIAKNISKGNSGSVNPLIPGKKHFAIFGFCDIRNFTDVTEVLQEEVMIFVNTIASIIHRTIDKYIGNANKNIGDAFLLVWKIPDEELELTQDEGIQLKRTKMVKSLCDLAVISYIKCIARLNSYPQIIKYSKNQKITSRIANYKVKMGFGLHLGWAIEGAIGSIFKIDASYLSPNVNIASRLEAATKQYGVPVLISNVVWEMCSNEMRRRMREIDKVTVKGSKNPLGLYTVDMNLENLEDKEEKVKTGKGKNLKEHKAKKEKLITTLENDEGKCIVFIESDEILVKMLTANYNYKEFYDIFHSGMEEYLGGKWKEARKKFIEGLVIKPNDGPTMTLMNFMETLGFEAPVDWKGYRELTEK